MKSVNDMRIFLAEVIAKSGVANSGVLDLQMFSLDGYNGCYVELTGDGTAKVEYGLSINGTDYIYSPAGASDNIVTAHTKTSGPGSDGKQIYSFSPITARFMKIRVTETGGVNPITVTVDVAIM